MTISLKTILPENITSAFVLELAQKLSWADLRWLRDQLDRLLEEEQELPETATLEEAVQFYLDDQCSLGRAAELAGVTRWDLQEALRERGNGVPIYSSKTVEEMDDLADQLQRKGLLC